jgi:drug/metabolite transporter (DMT)-like permease
VQPAQLPQLPQFMPVTRQDKSPGTICASPGRDKPLQFLYPARWKKNGFDMRGKIVLGVTNSLAAGALWGLVFLAPQVLDDFSPMQLAAARYLAYGVAAALLLAPRWRVVLPQLGRAEWGALAWLSVLGNILYYVLLASAVQWAGGASTSLIIGLLPLVVTVVGARDAGAIRFMALAPPLLLSLCGVALVGVESLLAEAGRPATGDSIWLRAAGLLCACGALISWSAYSIGNSRWLARRPQISAHDWSLLTGIATGALALLLVLPAFWQGPVHTGAAWLRFWGVNVSVAILASVVGNALWNRASRLLPLTLMGQMIVFETMFALLYGFLWEQRLPGKLEVLAILCLLTGVLWCASLHRRQSSPAQADTAAPH